MAEDGHQRHALQDHRGNITQDTGVDLCHARGIILTYGVERNGVIHVFQAGLCRIATCIVHHSQRALPPVGTSFVEKRMRALDTNNRHAQLTRAMINEP